MGKLTTHVLDTAAGQPAAGMKIELWQDEKCLASITTNRDGRADKPIVEGGSFTAGTYELRFYAGDYLRGRATLAEPLFLDVIPIRFGIADPAQHYHVPLLLQPFGYSTYRGS